DPLAAQIVAPHDVSIGPSGDLFVAHAQGGATGSGGRIRRVSLRLPAYDGSSAIHIASDDGSALYAFDASEHHTETLDTFTGAVKYTLVTSTFGEASLEYTLTLRSLEPKHAHYTPFRFYPRMLDVAA